MSATNKTGSSETTPAREAQPASYFVTTHWSVVVQAGRNDTTQALALEQLCRVYWYPLYAFGRRRGYSPPDAQDLTQEFFARLLERNWLARADQNKGRFRTFLLTALTRFLKGERDKARTLKRGGGRPPLPFEVEDGETRYGTEPADSRTPEQAFERHWAMALLEEVLRQLEAAYCADGKDGLFAALRPCLLGQGELVEYDKLGAHLGLSEAAVKMAIHRLRQRYRQLLRDQIAHTVNSADEVDAEMRHLFKVLVRPG